MAVDGKNFRVGALNSTGFLFLLFLLCSSFALAENTRDLRTIDLRRPLCDVSQMAVYGLSGVQFISEDKALVYSVCQRTGEPVLSIRGEFRASDSKHLRAVIVNVSTGKIEHRYDWPTQGESSFVIMTAQGNLLVIRENFLATYNLQGRQLTHLELRTANFHDPFMTVPSTTVSTVAVTELAMTVSSILVTATLVLDADALEPLYRWRAQNQSGNRLIAASRELCAGWQDAGNEKRIVIRKPNDQEWSTVWTGKTSSLLGPIFLDPGRFLVATDSELLVFNSEGKIEGHTPLKAAAQIAISRDGKHLAVASPADSPSAAFLPPTHISVFQTDFERTASLDNFANFEPDFTLALSPSGNRLGILGHMRLKVLEITK